ncbi:hypothetical protein GmHk_15G043746 [Glycine max]|nr:hypothetical protein GmHk_15G043746 [Glycine max]
MRLWEELLRQKGSYNDNIWCMVGDFNVVRSLEERRGIVGQRVGCSRETEEFNTFLDTMELGDIPMIGRKFTWYKAGGLARSILDRMVVLSSWLDLWPSSSQFILNRDISGHCPLVLKHKIINWGPKPFKVLNARLKERDFTKFVHQVYGNTHIYGWGAFKLKGKLKVVKK